MSDTKLMTYAELAEALGIGGDSARNLVRRKRWQRKPGNDGLARIVVPVEYMTEHVNGDGAASPPSDAPIGPPIDTPAGFPSDPPIDGGLIQAISRHLERLEHEVETLKRERDEERARAAALQIEAAAVPGLQQRLIELKTDRDVHIDRLEKELEAVKDERDTERARVTEMALAVSEVRALKAIIENEKARLEDVRRDRDRWTAQAEQLAAAAGRPWWRRLAG